MTDPVIHAINRVDFGTAASKRFRRQDLIPAIIYGANKDNSHVNIPHNEIRQHLASEAFFSSIIAVKIGRRTEKTILRNVQMHPYKNQVVHVDFQRISEKEKIRINAAIHFIGEEDAIGIKQDGGTLFKLLHEIEIECLPKDLPEYLEIDITNLELNDSVSLSDINLPEGVEITALLHEGEDQTVANIAIPRVIEDEEETEDEEGELDEEETDDETEADNNAD